MRSYYKSAVDMSKWRGCVQKGFSSLEMEIFLQCLGIIVEFKYYNYHMKVVAKLLQIKLSNWSKRSNTVRIYMKSL